MSDRETIEALLSRVTLKDRRAFDELYSHTSAKLFGVTLRILHDRQEAEEALQECFIKIWRKADSYAVSKASAMSWLMAIARNSAIDRLRKRREVTGDGESEKYMEDERPSPEDSAVLTGEVSRLHQCLDELDADRAEVIREAYLGGLKYQQLADMTKRPLGTIKSMVRRGLMALKQCIEAEPENAK
ncbi:sigma-70 family RNA polymerase sigma factor [Parvularcula flava]|uniref:RNA polymerase sigma factor n=1 Tax=Aquisalinus luteolus TaxID=1566827 RepID=A0A8J3A6M3_9PROT|nr:sigma-70 family RNA polymerase sigma factor [Aquisalinus luteolus]NHK27314.1 sigma-70 family RNA polymerase sigma factor [Aquisalinus luteolus]GGH95060.1 RNA polymerase sigma factor [Aquisalinus luteolus]